MPFPLKNIFTLDFTVEWMENRKWNEMKWKKGNKIEIKNKKKEYVYSVVFI